MMRRQRGAEEVRGGAKMNNMMRKRNSQSGFTFMELMIALIIFIVAVALVILATQGFFTRSRGTAMEGDIHTVQNAVGDYMLDSFSSPSSPLSKKVPTETGALPPTGQYALIDFSASFDKDVQTLTFYPDFLSKLPRHWDEGVWRIDNSGQVSVNMSPDDY
jgi:type II secretory pathway pseudopilin PulG